MAYSELPWRPFPGHQAWSWTTQRRGNFFITFTDVFFYFCHVFKVFNVFKFLFERFFTSVLTCSLDFLHRNVSLRWKYDAVVRVGTQRNIPTISSSSRESRYRITDGGTLICIQDRPQSLTRQRYRHSAIIWPISPVCVSWNSSYSRIISRLFSSL